MSVQADILSAGIVEWNVTSPRKQVPIYLMRYLNGDLLPSSRPLKDNNGGCVSECTITVNLHVHSPHFKNALRISFNLYPSFKTTQMRVTFLPISS